MVESVSKSSGLRPMPEMGLIGWLIAAGCFVILLPLLPIAILVYVAVKLVGGEREPPSARTGGGAA